ncbi:MAG: sulfate ABC transporter substrate-binding protein [Polyangiaceae bacterium]
MTRLRFALASAALALPALLAGGCGDGAGPKDAGRTLILAAYSAPREVLDRELLPAFTESYRATTGKTLRVEASYLASGAQTRAVLGGFAADVVLLAMAPDVDKLASAGLVSRTWAEAPDGGVIATSAVAFAVRTGNPKSIHTWADLARPGVQVLTPNPRTSGGAMWNVSALWGAALRGHAGFPPGDHEASYDYLRAVLGNVAVLDKGGRESILTFEKGVGDVAITYESEIVAGQRAGRKYDAVLPPSTLLVEIPAAVVHENAAKHGATAEAEALLAFLRTDAARAAFARHGFRAPGGDPPSPSPAPASTGDAAAGPALFRIADLGGWKTVTPSLFGPQGTFTRAWEGAVAAGD